MLLKEGKVDDALNVFKHCLKKFPDNANSYDSYAECLLYVGDYALALANYRKAFAMDPENMNAKAIIQMLQGKS